MLAAPERQAEIIRLIAEGHVEFVARVGDLNPLVASLVERRLRWADRSESALGAPWAGMPDDTAEIFCKPSPNYACASVKPFAA